MKKFILPILLFLMFIPFVVNAETCDTDKITISSINIENKSNGVEELDETTVSGKNINLNLSMNNLGDSITYKIVVNNESNKDYELVKKNLKTSSDYIDYTLESEDKSNIVKANSNKEFLLNAKYVKAIPKELFEGGSYNDNKSIAFTLSTPHKIINPKTGAQFYILLVVIVLLVSSIIFGIARKKKYKSIMTLIITIAFVIPISGYALCRYEIKVESNVKLTKMCKIIYESNNSSAVGEMPSNEYSYINKAVVKNNNYIDDGHVFKEWNTNRNGTGTTYKPGQVIEVDDDIVLYAIWRKKNDISTLIYWALQDNNNDNINERLVLSDSEVDGTIKGSFSGDEVFGNSRNVPWINGSGYNGDSLSDKVQEVIVENTITPISTKLWFYNVGDRATGTLNFDLEKLDTSYVKDMSFMFSGVGESKPETINIDLSTWDVSNVENMSHMFQAIGAYGAKEVNLNLSSWNMLNTTNIAGIFGVSGSYNRQNTKYNIDLSGWNMPKLTSFERLFEGFGENNNYTRAASVHLNLTGWNMPNVSNMKYMFFYASEHNTSDFIIDGLDSWDVSNVTNMYCMFCNAGRNAETFSIGDLSKWDVSNVTNMVAMFSNTGFKTNRFKLDLSKWNTSKVENMENMFSGTGASASEWEIIIPKNNGNGINNTSTKIYGASSSIYSSPDQGRTFTLSK